MASRQEAIDELDAATLTLVTTQAELKQARTGHAAELEQLRAEHASELDRMRAEAALSSRTCPQPPGSDEVGLGFRRS
jgi:hypothetical protein